MTVLFTDQVFWFQFFTSTVASFLIARSHAELNLKCFFITLAVESIELIHTYVKDSQSHVAWKGHPEVI